MAIFPEGASKSGAQPPWQFIHGGSGLDDVIEIASANTSAPLGVSRESPLFDEPGNGSMQAIVREDGTLERRTLATDPWNEDERAIVQPAVERIDLHAEKDKSGTIASVEITMHITESREPRDRAGRRPLGRRRRERHGDQHLRRAAHHPRPQFNPLDAQRDPVVHPHGTAGKVLLKVPGAKNVAAKVASSAVGGLLATDVKVLANRAGAAVATPTGVPIGVPEAELLASQGWRWSAHTHPGVTPSVLPSSVGDRAVLGAFGNARSAISTRSANGLYFKKRVICSQDGCRNEHRTFEAEVSERAGGDRANRNSRGIGGV